MRSGQAAAGIAFSLYVAAVSAAHAATAGGVQAIRGVEAVQAAALNRHDSHAYALLFAPDADVVNVLGRWWKSRAELEAKLGHAFAGVFRQSSLKIESVDVRFLKRDLAIAHVRWSMTGALSPDGWAE